jgi:hypothetical protein
MSKIVTVGCIALMMTTLSSGIAAAKKGKILISDEREVLAACERTWNCHAESHEGITVVCGSGVCATCSDKYGKCFTPAGMKGDAAFGCSQPMILSGPGGASSWRWNY